MTLSGLLVAAMLASAGSAAAAGGNYSVLPDTVDSCPEEADTCQSGDVIPIKSCEVQYGKGSMPVYNLETGDFMHCATAPPPLPPRPPPLPPGTNDDCKDNPMGCGGSWTPPVDECADADVECICADQEPEEAVEPEICALSCSECDGDEEQCQTDSETENIECRHLNSEKAEDMCGRYGGLSLGFGRGYEDTPSCIQGRTQGFPGLSAGSSASDSIGWSIGANGGVKFELGVFEAEAGGSTTVSGTMTTGTSSTVAYPAVPVDRSNFPNCLSEAGHAINACKAMLEQCRNYVFETTGESCDEDASYTGVFATFSPSSSSFAVYGPVHEQEPSRVTFKRQRVDQLKRRSRWETLNAKVHHSHCLDRLGRSARAVAQRRR